MALEALAVRSLASSVVHFIDLRRNSIPEETGRTRTWMEYWTNAELQAIAERKHQLNSGLVRSAGPFESVEMPTAGEQILQPVVLECQKIANDPDSPNFLLLFTDSRAL